MAQRLVCVVAGLSNSNHDTGRSRGYEPKVRRVLMKFFIVTANLNEIRTAVLYGFRDGVTTNPTLVSKEGSVDFKQHVAAICEIVQGPVSAEVTSQDVEGMLKEGREYAKIAPNVVIKCPL